MRQDAVTVSKSDSFKIPRNFDPKFILDIGIRTKFSTLGYASVFPEAKILSFSNDMSNFLADHQSLAYHDNIKLRFLPLHSMNHLDFYVYKEIPHEQQIDFVRMDIGGKEYRFLKEGGRWAINTKFIKVRLTDYDYIEAKSDLYRLGFDSAAMHDGSHFYVIGERID